MLTRLNTGGRHPGPEGQSNTAINPATVKPITPARTLAGVVIGRGASEGEIDSSDQQLMDAKHHYCPKNTDVHSGNKMMKTSVKPIPTLALFGKEILASATEVFFHSLVQPKTQSYPQEERHKNPA